MFPMRADKATAYRDSPKWTGHVEVAYAFKAALSSTPPAEGARNSPQQQILPMCYRPVRPRESFTEDFVKFCR